MSGFDLSKIETTLNRVEGFNNKVAQVGIPKGPTYPSDRGGQPVAFVAAIQEFGAPEASIPARPFIRPAVNKDKSAWADYIGNNIIKVILGKTTADDVLYKVGSKAQLSIQESIKSIHEPALSPITVLLRKWRKEGETITGKTVGKAARDIDSGVDAGSDDKPLIDDGILLSSINHAVNKKGSEFTV